jgi:hypothetical protein
MRSSISGERASYFLRISSSVIVTDTVDHVAITRSSPGDNSRPPVRLFPHGSLAMGRQAAVVVYVLAMVAVVITMDVLLFRNRFVERLMLNVGIVLVFGAFYLRFLNRP